MYYAESHGQSVTEDIYEGGILRYEKNSQPYCDLWRFKSKRERDDFVSNGLNNADGYNAISEKEARLEHKDQFQYWNN